MKTTGQVIGVVTVITLFAAIVVGTIWAVTLVARIWPRLDAAVATLALAAIGTTIVSARIIASGALRAKQWEWKERTRLERISLYDRLLQFATEDTPAYSIDDDHRALERRLLLIGAPAVLNVWRKLQSTDNGPASRDVLLLEMIHAMRKDLGVGGAAATSVLATPEPRSVRRTSSPQEHEIHHAR